MKHSLVDYINAEQPQKLFVEAIGVASSLSPSQPIVIVVDALDESDAAQLCLTSKVFAKAAVNLPHNAKFLVSSRPEDVISVAFATKHIERLESNLMSRPGQGTTTPEAIQPNIRIVHLGADSSGFYSKPD